MRDRRIDFGNRTMDRLQAAVVEAQGREAERQVLLQASE